MLLALALSGCHRPPPDELWHIAAAISPTNLPSTGSPNGLTTIKHPPSRAAYRRPKNSRPVRPAPTAIPSQTLAGARTDFPFGHTVAGVGDVDGDGFDDILIGAFNAGTNSTGEVQLYRGSPSGIIPKPWWTFPGPGSGAEFGHQVQGLGDVNGDSDADFGVGTTYYSASGKTPQTGGAFIFLGGPDDP